jgi:hypothetical protein
MSEHRSEARSGARLAMSARAKSVGYLSEHRSEARSGARLAMSAHAKSQETA